jgi:hypothetical protein
VTDFTLPDQHGRSRTLASLMGPKGLMLVFYRSADWCVLQDSARLHSTMSNSRSALRRGAALGDFHTASLAESRTAGGAAHST